MDREVLEGTGLVTFYDYRRFNPQTRKPAGYGFIHRHDVKCEVRPGVCRDKAHRVKFTVHEVQWVGAWNIKPGQTELKFRANPPKDVNGNFSPNAFRLELVERKRERPEKTIPASVAHGR